MTEATRNALLRRIDWRFLLPKPDPRKIVCFANGPIAEALKLVSNDVLSPDSLTAYGCDLAVAVNPSPQSVREAWRRLRAGGVFYAELRSPTIKGASIRFLRDVGFGDASIYRSWPKPEAAFCWAPTNSPAVKAYLFGTPRVESDRLRRYRDAMRRRINLTRFRFSAKLPLSVVARKPPMCAGDELDDLVVERWQRYRDHPASRTVTQLLLTPGARSFNKVINLFFEEPLAAPALAVKIARVRDSERALTREAQILESIHSAFPGELEGVPRVLFRTPRHGGGTFAETGFAGVPIFTRVNGSSYRDLALKGTEWLMMLPAGGRSCSRKDWHEQTIEPILANFERCYGAVAEPGQLSKAHNIISSLHILPLTIEQRDFSPWNILISPEGKLGVLDWESAQLEGLPMLDLIYFLTHLAFFLDRTQNNEDRLRSYHSTLERKTFKGAIHAECFSRYAQALKLSPNDLHPLRLLTWMVHAPSEYQDLAVDSGVPPATTLRNSLFFNLWQMELNQPLPWVQ